MKEENNTLNTAKKCYLHVFYTGDVLNKKQEKIVAKDAFYSLHYAMHTGRRFELGEEAISKDAEYSTAYAYYVLDDRFEMGEEAIATDGECSYIYAKKALKDRFELGETAILGDEELTRHYMKFLSRLV